MPPKQKLKTNNRRTGVRAYGWGGVTTKPAAGVSATTVCTNARFDEIVHKVRSESVRLNCHESKIKKNNHKMILETLYDESYATKTKQHHWPLGRPASRVT
jgi:hypothetical protein